MFLNKKMNEVTYFGMGPQESYRDKHQASCHGLFRSKVAQMHEDYIRPQENGSHYDCDYVEITSGQYGIAAVSNDSFSFNVSVYTQEELERASHNYELEESDSTVFCMDYAMNGIGSNSCGPDVLDKYRFAEEAFRFQFELIPFVKG
jgi:beta-galactosidase